MIQILFFSALLVTTCGQDNLRPQLNKLKNVVSALSRQVMLQQLAAEEKIRADGGSGIKQIRVNKYGPKVYYSNTHNGNSMAAMHDHSNNRATLGQGEAVFVLNGVEFRSRHNDYGLRMASTKSSKYNLIENVPFPEVPPAVLNKPTIQEQVDEMRLWFKAWKEQNYKVRDYRPYFKAVICYLEGGWTVKSNKIEEPFFSDRHALDADSWFDLQEKIRFTSYTGRKSLKENYAYLPTSIINITDTGLPVYAQWNYRMLCHPYSKDLPTRYFSLQDDLAARLPRKKTLWEHRNTRSARFNIVGPKHDRSFTRWTTLDSIMAEIPGRDNYVANITDTAFGQIFYDPVSKNKSLLNVGFYHRRYKSAKTDAMGLNFGKRGYSDPNVFIAENTQEKIAPMYLKECRKGKCHESLKRMTYAIPLEVIYLTPLSSWNPYNLYHHPHKDRKLSEANGRKGGFTNETAYNGTSTSKYYRTPTEFFSGGEVGVDPADTVKGSVGVLDRDGIVRRLSASGVRISMPKIPGVGVLRTRYPIMPVHAESSPVWKELNALKDIVMKLVSNEKYLSEKLPKPKESSKPSSSNSKPKPQPMTVAADIGTYLTLVMTSVSIDPPGEHSHTIDVTRDEAIRLKGGETIDFVSSEDNLHSHSVKVKFYNNRFHAVLCDDKKMPCWDGHTSCLMYETENSCPVERPEKAGSTDAVIGAKATSQTKTLATGNKPSDNRSGTGNKPSLSSPTSPQTKPKLQETITLIPPNFQMPQGSISRTNLGRYLQANFPRFSPAGPENQRILQHLFGRQ